MSQENVELARQATGGMDELFELLDEYVVRDFRAYSLPDFPDVEMGRDAFVVMLRTFWGAFDEYSLTARELIDAGQSVVVVFDEQGRGKGSGAVLQRQWAQVWTFRRGRIIRCESFRTREEALEAAGLSE
jgi:ketosteroid isomerase-like protein